MVYTSFYNFKNERKPNKTSNAVVLIIYNERTYQNPTTGIRISIKYPINFKTSHI